jgi:hypothetical protein
MNENSPLLQAAEQTPPVESAPADPYDGVALGVECAWPIETPA